jgi:hypothetical protein
VSVSRASVSPAPEFDLKQIMLFLCFLDLARVGPLELERRNCTHTTLPVDDIKLLKEVTLWQ